MIAHRTRESDEAGTFEASFTGQRQDIEAATSGGQYSFLMRDQNPTQGRWWTPDPSGLASVDPANPQSWNAYAYVNGRPLTSTDPLGLDDGGGAISTYNCGDNDSLCLPSPPPFCSQWICDPDFQQVFCYEYGVCDPWGSNPAGPTDGGGGTPVAASVSAQTAQPITTEATTHDCTGQARVLKGNAATIGKPGGFSTPRKVVRVTHNGAVVIPAQWGGAPALRPRLGKIRGNFPSVHASFSGVVDTAGSTAVPHVQQFLMGRYPGDLIIELPGAPRDFGVTKVDLTIPASLPCPEGTTDVP